MFQCVYPQCERTADVDGGLCDHHLADQAVDPQQQSFFEDEYVGWKEEWQQMPAFDQKDLEPFKSVIVHFANSADMAAFAELVEQRISVKTQSLWYPEAEIGRFFDKRYADAEPA